MCFYRFRHLFGGKHRTGLCLNNLLFIKPKKSEKSLNAFIIATIRILFAQKNQYKKSTLHF